MNLSEIDSSYVSILIGQSPQVADLAIVSIDRWGNPGFLNQMVLKEYGYSSDFLPNEEQLKYGFGAATKEGNKPILFVVTVGGNVAENLDKNLFNALVEFKGWFRNKKVWLPLMGTGDGELEFERSLSITIDVINRFFQKFEKQTTIYISIPDNSSGNLLWEKIAKETAEGRTQSEVKRAGNRRENNLGIDLNFFLAGSFWSGDDESQRFFEEGIWENGHEDKFIEVVQSVEPGDIVFLKSTFPNDGISYLRIKGVGVVIENPRNGTELDVDWRLQFLGVPVDIEDLGKYRRAFARVMDYDLDEIIDAIGKEKLINAGLLPAGNTAEQLPVSKQSIADLIGDTDAGEDYLDISKDVTAFSKVIASRSFKPPLAIALFGKWGSGKSFFMRKLKAGIERLRTNDTYGTYCKGIAHIHFNAWSYLDANLWASIVTKIFEELNDYITRDNKANKFKKDIEKDLTAQLTITREEVGTLEKQHEALSEQISELEGEKKTN